MWVVAIGIGAAFVLWVLINLKTSRKDATLVRDVHPYRKMMQYIMPTRNESIVYFDCYVDAEQLLDYLPRAKERFGADVTHCLLGAVATASSDNPQMNVFTVGRRLYQRREWQVTTTVKRQQLSRRAKLATVKLTIDQNETFVDLCRRLQARVGEERTDKRTYADKEFDLLTAMPRPLLRAGVKLFKWLDYHNLLPHGFIANDPLYTSMVITNLGSLGMASAYHHLYEWGNCPLFMMVGAIEPRPMVHEGQLAVRRVLHIRWAYDERIDDGLNARFGIDAVKRVLEHPFDYLGCLAEDGSDTRLFCLIDTNAPEPEVAGPDGAGAGISAAPPPPPPPPPPPELPT